MARTVWKTGICIAFGLAAGAAGLVRAAEEPAARPEPVLKHAVICPPFKGDPDLAARYHAELVALLKAEPGIEYLEGPRAAGRKAPEFSYRINGAIVAVVGVASLLIVLGAYALTLPTLRSAVDLRGLRTG